VQSAAAVGDIAIDEAEDNDNQEENTGLVIHQQ